jgi:hypothetical protein
MFYKASPAGTWYFQGLPGVGATAGFDVTKKSYPPLETTKKDKQTNVETVL